MKKLVFDTRIWKGKDRGDNSHCWKPATILSVHGDVATIQFHHDGHISHGHFLSAMRSL